MEDLIKELRSARKKKGMTQSELAHRLGLPQSHISNIEQGKIDLRASTLIQIARVLDQEVMLIPRQFRPLIEAIIEKRKDFETAPLWQPDQKED